MVLRGAVSPLADISYAVMVLLPPLATYIPTVEAEPGAPLLGVHPVRDVSANVKTTNNDKKILSVLIKFPHKV